ncbi:MAG: hypothetical protein PHS41_07770 [Victivallaceae bacterium]|nr:hypothetical protein [Victivallaceae bacterium]
MSIVTIIGAGMMGSAMSRPAVDRGNQVRMVGTPLDREIIDSVQNTHWHPTLRRAIPEEVSAYPWEKVDEALSSADLVVCGVSSFGIDWFTENVLPKLDDGMTVLSITKGMLLGEAGELTAFPARWKTLYPKMHFVAVGGPCICFELMDRRHTLVCYASEEIETARHVARMMQTPYYHLQPTSDVIGVECSVAMKNAYAMGVSLAVGLAEREKGITDARAASAEAAVPGAPDFNPVYNPQAALFAQSCIEMRRLVRLLGGDGDLPGGVPGAGDLYVTIVGGRTRRLGTLLGRGIPYPEVRKILSGVTLEAVAIITRVAEALRIRAQRKEVSLDDYPLLITMDAILNQGAEVVFDWEKFGH